jgi:hypothetical protein
MRPKLETGFCVLWLKKVKKIMIDCDIVRPHQTRDQRGRLENLANDSVMPCASVENFRKEIEGGVSSQQAQLNNSIGTLF